MKTVNDVFTINYLTVTCLISMYNIVIIFSNMTAHEYFLHESVLWLVKYYNLLIICLLIRKPFLISQIYTFWLYVS